MNCIDSKVLESNICSESSDDCESNVDFESDSEQSTIFSVDHQDRLFRVLNQQPNTSELSLDDVTAEWYCEHCEQYINSNQLTCPVCNHNRGFDDDEMSFMIEFGLVMLQNSNLQHRPTEEPKQALLTYKQYRENVTAHRGTKRLRETKNVDEICPVCCMELKCGRLWHETECGHFFHPMCLRNVCCRYGPRPSCPICRHDIGIVKK